jgi:hypothetical protein
VDSERADAYLRGLAEAALGRPVGRGSGRAAARVRAVASAFAEIGALDRDRAESVVDDLTAALAVQSSDDEQAMALCAPLLRYRADRYVAEPAGSVSIAPISGVLELRGGETDVDIYLIALIRTGTWAHLSAGILSMPKGSLPRRNARGAGLRRQVPSQFAGIESSPVPGDLLAVAETGHAYDLVFGGLGTDTWRFGDFIMSPSRHGPRQPGVPEQAAWLDVGNDENSVRVDLTARRPAGPAA